MAPEISYLQQIQQKFPDYPLDEATLTRLYHFGLLGAIPVTKGKLKLLEQELDELHLDAKPTYQQGGLYRLILELEREELKLPNLFSTRITGLWTPFEQSYYHATPLTRQRMRKQFPDEYRDLRQHETLRACDKLKVQFLPCLFDRMHEIDDQISSEILQGVPELLGRKEFGVLWRRCFDSETFSEIAKIYKWSCSNTTHHYQRALTKLRTKTKIREPLRELFFGSGELGTPQSEL